jgi:hypothetical protein
MENTAVRNIVGMIVGLLMLSGCGGFDPTSPFKKKRSKSHHQPNEFFLHGDPMILLANAERDTKSFFTINDLERFNRYSLASWTSFGQSSKANESLMAFSTRTSTFRFVGHDYVGRHDNNEFVLRFEVKDGVLELKSLRADPDLVIDNLEVLHYSMKEDQSAFSILSRFEAAGSTRILNLVFTDDFLPSQRLERAPRIYNYLRGNDGGVRTIWKEPEITLSYCGVDERIPLAEVQKSYLAWHDPRSYEGQPKLSFKNKATFKPFSDLNEQCLYVFDDYGFETNNKELVMGLTLFNIHENTSRIVDSDIFIPTSAFERQFSFTNQSHQEFLQSVIKHEIGHFLGLGHEFDGDYESIMSYDDIKDIKPGDYDALRHLYQRR